MSHRKHRGRGATFRTSKRAFIHFFSKQRRRSGDGHLTAVADDTVDGFGVAKVDLRHRWLCRTCVLPALAARRHHTFDVLLGSMDQINVDRLLFAHCLVYARGGGWGGSIRKDHLPSYLPPTNPSKCASRKKSLSLSPPPSHRPLFLRPSLCSSMIPPRQPRDEEGGFPSHNVLGLRKKV